MAERGELEPGKPHPSAFHARQWIAEQSYENLCIAQEAYSSCAIEGNPLAEVCSETLRRLMNGEPVSDRYVLGLAWNLRHGGEDD